MSLAFFLGPCGPGFLGSDNRLGLAKLVFAAAIAKAKGKP